MGVAGRGPDLLIWAQGGGHFAIELKAEAGRLSPTRRRTGTATMASLGHRVYVCRSVDDVEQCLRTENVTPIGKLAVAISRRCAGKGALMARNTSVAKKPASLPATKPEPTEAEQAEIRALAKRKKTRRQAPRFAVDQQDGGQVQMMPAGVHADAAAARVMNAMGTTSVDLADRLSEPDPKRDPRPAAAGGANPEAEPERRRGRRDGHRPQGRG